MAYLDPRAQLLAQAMSEEMAERYGDEGASPAHPADFDPPGLFLLAWAGDEPVGCGGIRLLAPGVGEIKRMYVAPAARGRGASKLLLSGLVAHGSAQGWSRLQLETGTLQPEALGLYRAQGWHEIPAYGHYREDPRSLCFALEL